MTDADTLRARARQAGVSEGFFDLWGAYHPASPASLEALLAALGDPGPAPPVPPVTLGAPDAPQEIAVTVPEAPGPWTLTLEAPGGPQALLGAARSPCPDQPDRVALTGRLLTPLPLGLHPVRVEARAGGAAVGGETLLVVAPPRGHEPEALARGERLWGINLPLYGVRSARNGGVGDFEDLARLAEWAASLGADLLGVLPLHALGNEAPYGISPYFPVSRAFLNPALVAVDALAEAAAPEVRALFAAPAVTAELARLRGTALVDHGPAWALKRRLLAACFGAFGRDHRDGPRGAAFHAWRAAQGPALEDFATFCALHELHPGPWPEWPAALRSPRAPGVAAFRRAHGDAVAFFAWTQWVAEEQLAGAQARARAAGMAVGLYLDLALGVDPAGADAWVFQDVLALSASAGAPPDPFSLMGQRWGVPPAIPHRHRASGYAYFRETVVRNARRAGALRIDHVLALWRLFWVPGDRPAAEGAYVAERPQELLALLRLISRQERCLVIGEDLGTVPDEVRRDLMASGFLSYRLLIFEKGADGAYRAPQDFPRPALVSVSTHDLPPLDGFWLGRDLRVKAALAQYPTPEAAAAEAEGRGRDRQALLAALAAEGLLPPGVPVAPEVDPRHFDALAPAVHAYLARTPAALLLANLDDLVGEVEMHNLPATLDEHPNWQRKGPVALEDLPGHPRAAAVAAAIRREGRGVR